MRFDKTSNMLFLNDLNSFKLDFRLLQSQYEQSSSNQINENLPLSQLILFEKTYITLFRFSTTF